MCIDIVEIYFRIAKWQIRQILTEAAVCLYFHVGIISVNINGFSPNLVHVCALILWRLCQFLA